jgi:deoxyinosine 3'endonuclease (endonuclease V)
VLVILPKVRELSGASDSFPLITSCGALLGKAVLTVEECTNPVYVSVGHRLSLDTAVKLVVQCSKYRVPEPVRQADIQSRSFIQDNFKSVADRLHTIQELVQHY